MDYSYFIGIDVSKLKLDVAVKNQKGELIRECVIENTAGSLHKFIDELQKDDWLNGALFCLEPTGHYSNVPVAVLIEKKLSVWMASPVDIQRSIGLTRGKNDKIDAARIAEYAYRYTDKARLATAADLEMLQIRELLSQRETLVTDKAKYQAQIKDFKGRISETAYAAVEKVNTQIIQTLRTAIRDIEEQIEQLVKASEKLNEKYELLQTIPGIGKVLAQTIIASTSGFERFTDPRSFACHAGIAPFQYTSGSSIRGRNRVSHRANKRLKSLLHLAALCCIRIKGELKEYYNRKVAEGKSKMTVINAIRNKIVHRIFAVINRNSPYQNLVVS